MTFKFCNLEITFEFEKIENNDIVSSESVC